MNCKQVQELLPLFVGHDLEEKQATLVTAHIQSCEDCARSADEYRETQQLMRLFTPPPLSEEDYAGMRRSVLREIERGPAAPLAPTLPQLLGNLFRPRIRLAIATGLVIAVSVFAFYFVANRKNDPQQVVENAREIYPNSADERSNPRAGQSLPPTVSAPPRTPQLKKESRAADRPRSLNSRVMTAQVSPRPRNIAQQDAFPANLPDLSEKTMRVEIQTKDPNIRIIWFAPRTTKHDSPNKSSKRHQEVRSNA